MDETIEWLLAGDSSIQYMTHRFLLGADKKTLKPMQEKIESEGFCKRFLSCQNEDGHWGRYYYQPKWTSTHYTLTDIKNLYPCRDLKPCVAMIKRMFDECAIDSGCLNLAKSDLPSDICVDGMVLNYASYFCPDEPRLNKLVEHLVLNQKPDGGFTWDWQSDVGCPHTTICVLEGLLAYCDANPRENTQEIKTVVSNAEQFLFANALFINHSDKRFKILSYPYRYRYDLLRVLDYFALKNAPYDERMQPALDWLIKKRNPDGRWILENCHKGNVHFEMEPTGEYSRFITLKALYILSKYH